MTATKVETFGKAERRTQLLHEREVIGMADGDGKCRVVNEIKIANCFGQFTSLLTGITIEFPCDPENFEEEALQYHARTTKAIQGFQNRTLEAVGKDKVWHGKTPPKPSGKTASVRKPAKKKAAAKKSGGKAPAARKRVPRRS
jgi:hypothetical protein